MDHDQKDSPTVVTTCIVEVDGTPVRVKFSAQDNPYLAAQIRALFRAALLRREAG